jgi:hypothetical protein
VASGGLITIIVAKLSGGGLQTFWSMVSVLSDVLFNALVNVQFLAFVAYRQSLMMSLAKIDVFSLEDFWSTNFKFLPT